jgi:hypothetical protein
MLTRRWRKILLAAASLIIAAIAFAGWYRWQYSMTMARSFEVGDPQATRRVLIATQGSEFKDAVVAGVVEHLKARAAHIKVIDISMLSGVDERDWNAVVLIHTWEMRKPPEAARVFVERVGSSGKLVVLTTSGAGDFKMEGVDAITSASVVAEAPSRAADIAVKLDAVLARAGA